MMTNKELVERYPFLRPYMWTGEPIENYNYEYTWLDDIPLGWRKAFGEQMCEEIREALVEEGYLDKYKIFQIKEKFAELRIYSGGYNKDSRVPDIINKYADMSIVTCIKCGAPATQITKGWISPYCDECVSKFDYPQKTVPIEEYYDKKVIDRIRANMEV